MHRYDILTIHPEMLRGPLLTSILGRAVQAGTIAIGLHDIREHGLGRHRAVDDAPFGGGAGMVMRVDVVAEALEAVRTPESHVILLTAGGERFDQARARRLAEKSHLVLLCGHYEGIDARIESLVDERLSIGDFVLTGGEIAAAAVVDAVARLVPGVLHNPDSPLEESFARGLLEYPHYTRPRSWRGLEVPEVLLSGDHARIAEWRRAQAESVTAERRPDLWAARGGGVDDPEGSD